MKLRTKISAAVVIMLLIFSQLFSAWLLYEMREESIETIVEYEKEKMQRKVVNFENQMDSIKEQQELNDKMESFYGKDLFQRHFADSAALYYGEEEICNISPYEFNLKAIERKLDFKEKPQGVQRISSGVFKEKTDGKELLILYMEIKNFRMIYYKDISPVYENTRQLFYRGVLGAALLSALMLVILRSVIQRLFRPLGRLEETARSLEKGNYEERITELTKDEIGDISRSFNQMADRVEEHIRELAKKNERQRNLLGSLAHELKTPMTAIQGYAETLQRLSLPPEKQAKSLHYIEKECKRLSRLSAKMMELTGLSDEEAGIEKRPLNISALFEKVRAITRYRLQEKKIHLEIEVEEELEIQGDEDLLLSFFTNLVDNGCKASREESTIRLIGKKEGLFVQDEGRGIPAEELGKITEPFYMVDKSRSRKEGGAGLGLALCQQIAQLHGGTLEIKSEEGKGTCAGLVTVCLHPGEDLDTEISV